MRVGHVPADGRAAVVTFVMCTPSATHYPATLPTPAVDSRGHRPIINSLICHLLFPPPAPPCSQQLDKLRAEVRAIVAAPKNCLPFLQPGRLVRVLPPEQPGEAAAAAAPAAAAAAAAAAGGSGDGGGGSGSGVLGVVINFERAGKQQQGEGEESGITSSSRGSRGGKGGGHYIVDVLCNCSEDSLRHQSSKR